MGRPGREEAPHDRVRPAELLAGWPRPAACRDSRRQLHRAPHGRRPAPFLATAERRAGGARPRRRPQARDHLELLRAVRPRVVLHEGHDDTCHPAAPESGSRSRLQPSQGECPAQWDPRPRSRVPARRVRRESPDPLLGRQASRHHGRPEAGHGARRGVRNVLASVDRRAPLVRGEAAALGRGRPPGSAAPGTATRGQLAIGPPDPRPRGSRRRDLDSRRQPSDFLAPAGALAQRRRRARGGSPATVHLQPRWQMARHCDGEQATDSLAPAGHRTERGPDTRRASRPALRRDLVGHGVRPTGPLPDCRDVWRGQRMDRSDRRLPLAEALEGFERRSPLSLRVLALRPLCGQSLRLRNAEDAAPLGRGGGCVACLRLARATAAAGKHARAADRLRGWHLQSRLPRRLDALRRRPRGRPSLESGDRKSCSREGLRTRRGYLHRR